MKLLLSSDPHLTEQGRVACRSDNMLHVSLGVLSQIRDIVQSQYLVGDEIKYWLVAGDLFDDAKEPNHTLLSYIGRIPIEIVAVRGQHDSHKDVLQDSAFDVLYQMKKLTRIEDRIFRPVCIKDTDDVDIKIYGVPFCVDLNKALHQLECINKELDTNERNILLLHQPISFDKGLLRLGVAKYSPSDIWHKLNNFDLVLYGDMHTPDCTMWNKTLWLNTGPMVRHRISELILEPKIYIYDTIKKALEWKNLKDEVHLDQQYVQNQEKVKELKKLGEKIQAAVKAEGLGMDEVVVGIFEQILTVMEKELSEDGPAKRFILNLIRKRMK